MTDQKPKHKPQKKRTLEEVLKSLQDLIRNDLISAKPLQESWRESGRATPGPRTTASEPDSFHNALFKLDQIISEKIIEPVERAQQTPPEPLYPDEEIEIEWDGEVAADSATGEEEAAETESPNAAASDRGPPSLVEEIEIEALAPDAAPPSQVVIEPQTEAPVPAPEADPESRSEVEISSEPAAPEPAVEEIEATSVEISEDPATDPVEAKVDPTLSTKTASPAPVEPPETQTSPETIDDQQRAFDFAAAMPARIAKPALGPRPDPAPPPHASRETEKQASTLATVAEPNVDETAAGGDAGPGDFSPVPAAPPADTSEIPSEQPDTPAVESNGAGDAGAFTVEFMVEPKLSPPDAVAADDTSGKTAASAPVTKPSADEAKHPPGKTGVKKKPQSPDPTDAAKKSPKRAADDDAPKTHEEIPILEEVADLLSPPAAPLPSASQARDIAIRVIAKLNIERRKTGEKPLDIKTIERLQQYLADALSKRALNKPK